MRLQQAIMSGVAPSKSLENNPRDSKTPASIPISEEIFPGKSGSIFECGAFWGRQVALPRSFESERGNLFILLRATQASASSVYASVEALLPCKGGTRFDCL